ncbi:MAG: hypothetical protein RSB96_03190 [Oscillospiraceae bacterium]
MKVLKNMKLIIFGVFTLGILGYLFVEVPNINPFFLEGAFFWCFIVTGYIAIWGLLRFGEVSFNFVQNAQQKPGFNYVPNRKFPGLWKFIVFAPWVFLVAMLVISSPLISWKAYRDQLGTPDKKVFSSDIQAIDTSKIPIIDKQLALNLADKELGSRPSLGNQVDLGEPTIQKVNDELVWIVPLQHSGFFKWLTNMGGSPGYIVVSATNRSDAEYVENFKVKYQPNLYLFDDLVRHIRFKGYFFKGIIDYSFEVDDNWQPHWVITTYENERGFALPESNGVLILNASTGEIQEYGLDNIPDWVDRVQPEEFIIRQIDNQGQFVKGIFNFANKDKFKASLGHAIVYNKGRCYLFTGLTSVGKDESAIGFIMVDMVTKESILYEINGATEISAQRSAEGKVQHLQYLATFPLILNINGQPTYFMALKDKVGLVKQYAFVSVSDYSIVGTGEEVSEALTDYTKVMRNYGTSSFKPDVTVEKETITGIIKRIAVEYTDKQASYKIILEEKPGKIFILPSSISDELALSVAGDTVTIEHPLMDSDILIGNTFENNNI